MGEIAQLFAVLEGLRSWYTSRGEYQSARELDEECLTLAQRQHDPALLMQAHMGLGGTLFWLGELAPARAHLEQALAYNVVLFPLRLRYALPQEPE